jgi:hypothetical protein
LIQSKADAQIKINKRQQEKWLAEHPEYAK